MFADRLSALARHDRSSRTAHQHGLDDPRSRALGATVGAATATRAISSSRRIRTGLSPAFALPKEGTR